MPDFHNHSDQDLVALLNGGDQYAYTEIFDRYSALLVAHAYRLLGDRDEANDVVQDVFMILWQKHASLELTTSLSSYLYTSIRNRIFNKMSHNKVVARYADSILEFMEKGYSVSDEVFLAKELEQLIEREIAALPEKMREVFILHKQQELSYKEIGEKMGISDKTAKQQVYNAMKILKTKINSFMMTFLV
jgi:RNA polymerase sigma-70 factor (ECF subfamily)